MRSSAKILIVLLLCAGGLSVGAETVSHTFQTLNLNSKIAFSASNTVGTTDLVTYTCSGTGSAFGAYASEACICLTKLNNNVVISPALNNLQSIQIAFLPTSVPASNIKVYVSTDGSTWSSALTDVSYPMASGVLKVNIPAGYYFLKILNSMSSAVYIHTIEFEFDDCPSCYTYDY